MIELKKIKTVVKLPNENPVVKEIDNDYHELKDICQGVIDFVDMPGDERMCICCNDCFLYNGMEANIVLPEQGQILAGPIVFMGYDPDTGDNISLTDAQVDKALKYIDKYQTPGVDLITSYNIMKSFQHDLQQGVDMEV